MRRAVALVLVVALACAPPVERTPVARASIERGPLASIQEPTESRGGSRIECRNVAVWRCVAHGNLRRGQVSDVDRVDWVIVTCEIETCDDYDGALRVDAVMEETGEMVFIGYLRYGNAPTPTHWRD